MLKHWQRRFSFFKGILRKDKMKISVTRAPEPDDIIWENMYSSNIKKIII